MKAYGERIVRWAEDWPNVVLDIAQGKSLRKCCEERDVTLSRAHEWIMADPERARQYNLAYTIQADLRADEVDEIAQELDQNAAQMTAAQVQAKRVAIDAKKWSAGIRNRKKYGDRQTLEVETPQDPRDAKTQLEQLRKELGPVLSIVSTNAAEPGQTAK